MRTGQPLLSGATRSRRSGHRQASVPATDDIKFEAALAELEQIVRSMEDGQLPLEESISAYRRGSELLKKSSLSVVFSVFGQK